MAQLGGIVELALGNAAQPEVVDTGGAFVIQELTGDRRLVALTGRGLPYRPVEFGGTQRVEVTWLPGYAVATATVLGPTDKPTTVRGFWKERFIGQVPGAVRQPTVLRGVADALVDASSFLSGGFDVSAPAEAAAVSVDGRAVTSVADVVELFDDVMRRGQLLQVTWGPVVRLGHLTSFTPSWHNTRDAEWEATFDWTSRGGSVAAAQHALSVTADDTRSLLEGALGDALAILAEAPAISSELSDRLTSQLQRVSSLVDAVSDAVVSTADAAALPADTARRVVGLLRSIEFEAEETALQVESRPADAWHIDAQPATRVGGTSTFLQAAADGDETGEGGIARLSATQRVQAADTAARLRLAMRALRRLATERRVQMARQVSTTTVGTFTAREGEDLRDASFQFYGTPDEWRRIMLFNGLRSAELEAGQVVVVPALFPNGESGELSV